MGRNASDARMDARHLADLLKYGAHMLKEEEHGGAAKAEEEFKNENIDDILRGRTEKRALGSRKGNAFSVARVREQGLCSYHDL